MKRREKLLSHGGSRKDPKNSCCGNFKIEELPKEPADNKKTNDSSKANNKYCGR